MNATHLHDEQTVARFGRYDVIQTLGTGGMASVYLAMLHDGNQCTFLALKQSHGASSPSTWAEAMREARCGASIKHRNVVGIVEVGVGAQGPYIVMEYVDGGSVLNLLSAGADGRDFARRLPPRIANRIVVDTLRGLHAAHNARDEVTGQRLGLVHRDVSPQNVLVGTDGVAKLADFGIAKLVQVSNTGPGLVRGKPGYVSPEQTVGQPLDARADLFSMGVVMWECLAGRRLFRGRDQQESLMQVLKMVQPDLSALFADIPGPIADICARALAKRREARPVSADAFANDLEDAALNTGTLAPHIEVGQYVRNVLSAQLSRRSKLLAEWCSTTRSLAPRSLSPMPGVMPTASQRIAEDTPPTRIVPDAHTVASRNVFVAEDTLPDPPPSPAPPVSRRESSGIRLRIAELVPGAASPVSLPPAAALPVGTSAHATQASIQSATTVPASSPWRRRGIILSLIFAVWAAGFLSAHVATGSVKRIGDALRAGVDSAAASIHR